MQFPRPLPDKGPVLRYLERLRLSGQKQAADDATRIAIAALSTPEGRALLELIEIVTIFEVPGPDAPVGASLARNAQALMASDLRRLLTDETHRILAADDQKRPGPTRRRPGRTTPG